MLTCSIRPGSKRQANASVITFDAEPKMSQQAALGQRRAEVANSFKLAKAAALLKGLPPPNPNDHYGESRIAALVRVGSHSLMR